MTDSEIGRNLLIMWRVNYGTKKSTVFPTLYSGLYD